MALSNTSLYGHFALRGTIKANTGFFAGCLPPKVTCETGHISIIHRLGGIAIYCSQYREMIGLGNERNLNWSVGVLRLCRY